MDLQGLVLSPEALLLDIKVKSVKQLLQLMSDTAAKLAGISAKSIFEQVWHREMQDSTSVNHGVAIPHGYAEGINSSLVVFSKLAEPIYFASTDYIPTDLVFFLVSPVGQEVMHLQSLAKIARLARNNDFLKPLREMHSQLEVYKFFCCGAYSMSV